jgi:hypothetical protein
MARTAHPITRDWLDPAAMSLSVACLIHCLGLPLLLTVVPWAVPSLLQNESFHLWAVAAALPLSLVGIGLGFRQHRSAALVVLAAVGLGALLFGALLAEGERSEVLVTLFGATALLVAHSRNWILSRRLS